MTDLDSLLLAVHLVGAAIWVGGSISLGVVASTLGAVGAERRGPRAGLVAEVARRLARVMWPALGLTILTGLYNLTWFLPPGASLTANPWLVAKGATVIVVVLAAGLHTFGLGPRLRAREAAGAPAASLVPLRRANLALGMTATVASVLVLVFAAFLGGP